MLPVTTVPGLAFICTMCEHMANAVENGSDGCGKSLCGGPAFGKSFPLYKGPLQSVLLNFCYKCGEDSTQVLEIDGEGRLGICSTCLKNFLDIDSPSE